VTGAQVCSQRDLSGRIRAGHGGGLRDPGVGVGEPGVLRGAGLVGGGHHFQLERLDAARGAVELGDYLGVLARNQWSSRTAVHPVQQRVHLGHT
jgi:hypothetical protein